MDHSRFKVLFQRYIENTCTESELAEFWKMVESGRNDRALQAMMDTLWQSPDLEEKLPEGKTGKILNEILSENKIIPLKSQHRERSETPRLRAWMGVAAAVTILIVSTLFVIKDLERRDLSIKSTVTTRVEVSPDEHRYIQLPDGSIVILNAGSTLDYSDSFNGRSTREVTLTGEGYFDIVHDPEKPFIVHTGKLKTTVLGTAFNIRAYAEDNNITVTVTRGKVKVSDEEREIGILNPDQQITFDGKNRKAEQQAVNSKTAIAWAENDIFFNEVTVGEAVKRLEERFSVTVTFEHEKLKDCRFTATFVHNEDLEQILAVICEFNNATYTTRDDTILISGDGC